MGEGLRPVGQAAVDEQEQVGRGSPDGRVGGVCGCAGRIQANAAGDTSVITVAPAHRPSSESTEHLVQEIRKETGHDVLVTGTTALNIDFSQKMNSALMPYLALVVGLAFILLMIVFRSVLVPLKAALGFLLQ